MGRLISLYIAPGTADRFSGPELVAEIMAAVRESSADAGRQYQALMDATMNSAAGELVPPSARKAGA
ncbi:hypothetical protein DFR69_1225 [Nocardia neocaledoniensis]|uniref:Uncharacterized protein n=2 Tax=Nocardia neocaledoniensis TaxID=236511 RepID=A0A317N1W8_9NOCA|nr:hypothetical protein DFR69_1225 [Nocardia neocaledoniensis]